MTIASGIRKEFALKTADETEAIQRAEELDSIYAAPNMEVAVAQINAIKGFSKQAQMLPLSEGWAKYEIHPERATPHTVSEQLAYKTTYDEFVEYVSASGKHTVIKLLLRLPNSTAILLKDMQHICGRFRKPSIPIIARSNGYAKYLTA